MILLCSGNYVYKLLYTLLITGEFPLRSLGLIGNYRVLYSLLYKLESRQMVRLADGDVFGPVRLISISGKHPNRTIRLSKYAFPILEKTFPEALSYYYDAFFNHHFPGNIQYILRNHRVAETIACFMEAGIESQPFVLPKLQNSEILQEVPDWPRFYLARETKRISNDDFNKTMFSRMVGAAFYPGGHYTVYNTRDAVMRWKGHGEVKAAVSLDELARWNNGEQPGIIGSYSALLLGKNQDIALESLNEASKERQKSFHYNSIYYHLHFIPLNIDGIRLLRILTTPDWKERILDCLFPPEMRIDEISNLDAQRDGLGYASHLDSDIARIIRIKQAVMVEDTEFICYPWQAGFLRGYLGNSVKIRTVEMKWIEEQLGISSTKTKEMSDENTRK